MLGKLADLASMAGMPSEPTLRKLIAADPDFGGVIKRGSNGDAYEIDLEVAARYVLGIEERKRAAERERLEGINQLALDMGLGGGATVPGFTIADRKALLEEEVIAIKVGRERGTLVEKAGVEAAIGGLLVWHQAQAMSFSARLARRADLGRELTTEIDALVRADLAEFGRRLRAMANVEIGGDGSSDPAASALDSPAL